MAWTLCQQVQRLARDILDYYWGNWCLTCTTVTFFLGIVAVVVYAAGAKLVALHIFLSACALWLFLIFCGVAKHPCLNPDLNLGACMLWSVLSTVVFGWTFLIVVQIINFSKQENKVNFDASSATLTRFNYTSSNNSTILNYHLSLNVNVGPNKKNTGVYYHSIQARAYYQGQGFRTLSIPPFYLGGKMNHTYNSTVVLHPVFQGQQAVVLVGDGLRRYLEETATRRHSINVTLSYVGIRINDCNDHNLTATDSNDMLNKAGHQVKGVVMFGLKVHLSSSDEIGIASPHSGVTKSFEY